jgi:hypothetical protein
MEHDVGIGEGMRPARLSEDAIASAQEMFAKATNLRGAGPTTLKMERARDPLLTATASAIGIARTDKARDPEDDRIRIVDAVARLMVDPGLKAIGVGDDPTDVNSRQASLTRVIDADVAWQRHASDVLHGRDTSPHVERALGRYSREGFTPIAFSDATRAGLQQMAQGYLAEAVDALPAAETSRVLSSLTMAQGRFVRDAGTGRMLPESLSNAMADQSRVGMSKGPPMPAMQIPASRSVQR